ncbi:MAG: competence/damage-inducible protein A [Verrucomicrobiae bacterium]|nr:competence/damage-inducible protein A [Verrucomicrobiae bacterium]MCP5541881.1 competence/damage-inducible protein A [Akkermansiaceae bacterium]
MRVEVINTGTELLLGKVINTHAAFFGDRLFTLGLRVGRQVAIPDGEEIRQALLESFPRADIVLVTGGLGPTSDDITREIVADMLGRELRRDDAIWRHIRAFFVQRGREPSPANERQAMVPEGAVVLSNPHGTAPGLYLPAVPGETPHLFLLPGPPRELRPMFAETVDPILRKLAGGDAAPRPWRNFKIFGVGESSIASVIEDALAAVPGLEHGYCARLGEVDVRLIGTEEAVAAASEIVRRAFPIEIVTESEDSLETVLVRRLAELGQTVATAESCTGGKIACTLTDVDGSSAVFHRGYVTYANEAKADLLGVPEAMLAEHGAVSEPVAGAMAEGCRERADSDHALAVSGIAGPGGGSDEKPVGTVFIALASRGLPVVVSRDYFPLDRLGFKERVTREALDLLRKRLDGLL